jgi:predicted RNA binding protein YcfA (HicA-like mRNA interferase family)
MSPARLPALKAREVIRALEKAGFSIVRTSGSHFRLVHDAERELQLLENLVLHALKSYRKMRVDAIPQHPHNKSRDRRAHTLSRRNPR